MHHIIVTRFSVPRPGDATTTGRHADVEWLASRLRLFRRYYVPAVGRLGVPAVLLCSAASAPRVAADLDDLSWARVVEQDDWYGGWSGAADQVLTRLDSDDALHEGWFDAVDRAPPWAEVVCSHAFLRLDVRRDAVYRYRRRTPSPLAAFRGGVNPYAHDHQELRSRYRTAEVEGAFLLQVAHGDNLSNRFPKRLRRRAGADQLRGFGIPSPGS